MSTTSIPRHVLSKSTFIRGCQCVKSLWLHKYQSSLRDEMSAAQAGIFSMGTNVGEVARGLFPGGLDASPIDAFHYQQSVADTATYLAQGHTIIYEAAFQSNGVLAAIDILVKQDEKWYAYEVKSSTQVKDTFLQDAALQYHVITGAGIALKDIFLVHINNKYIKQGPLDVEQLFQKVSLKEDVLGLQNFIETKTLELIEIIGLKQMPGIAIGDQCNSPYPCDFTGYCWKDEVEEDSEKE